MANENIVKIIHQQKHDTGTDWAAKSFYIPEVAELVVYDPDPNTPYTESRYKIGDGVRSLAELPFINSEVLAYELNPDGRSVSVSGIGNYTESIVVIPDVFNGKLVTQIKDYAFTGCNTIEQVFIPKSVKSIGIGAFEGCKNLAQVSIEDNSLYTPPAEISSSATITSRLLINTTSSAKGRSFVDGEGIQLGKDLEAIPLTFEATIFVPTTANTKGSIFSNNYPVGMTSVLDFGVNENGYPTIDVKQQTDDIVSTRSRLQCKQDIRGSWKHVVITREYRSTAAGDLYTFYYNGDLLDYNGSSNKKIGASYWTSDETGKLVSNNSNKHTHATFELDQLEKAVSMYVGQAAGYDSGTELAGLPSTDPNYDSYNGTSKKYSPTNFKGQIQNLAVYKRTLTAAEVKANYESGINLQDPDILFCLDMSNPDDPEVQAGYIADLTGHGYDTVPLHHERSTASLSGQYDYSFAVLGDTQFLVDWDVKKNTSYTAKIFDWLVANKEAKKIARVLHVGDIVEVGRLDSGVTDETKRTQAIAQWTYAKEQFDKLENARIPYTVTWGYSHDSNSGEELTTYFGDSQNFTESDIGYYFSDPESSNYSKRLANYYQRFEVCGIKYLIMNIEYRPNSAVLAWADSVIKANSAYKVIINTHYFLDHYGRISQEFSEIRAKWDTLANENKNVEMILCGHIDNQNNIVRAYTVAQAGQTVAQFLINPQQLDRYLGYDDTSLVAMFYFSNQGKNVKVEFISTSRTLAAQETNPQATDVLYGRKNTFSFNAFGEKTQVASDRIIDTQAFKDCNVLSNIMVSGPIARINAEAFAGCTRATILMEESMPSGEWDASWNPLKRPVIWGASMDIAALNVEIEELRDLIPSISIIDWATNDTWEDLI